ncbi:HET domain-containing protein [Fusarium sp. LHS14.1]|nr:HET domain-containing protein [Fusarium sp. LHS14.1]
MELPPGKDAVDDEFCAWYSRPDLEHDCFSHNANVLPTDLCTECKESASHKLIKIYTNNLRIYTFRKTYEEICRDAAVCALCRAIDDSTHLSRLLPTVATPPVIPPPDSTIFLEGDFDYSPAQLGCKGYFVSAMLSKDGLLTDSGAQSDCGHEIDKGSGEGDSTRSSSRLAHESRKLGYLDLIMSQSIDTDANLSPSESADSELERLQGATVDLCIASPSNPNISFPVGSSGRGSTLPTLPSMRSTLLSWLQTCDDEHEGCVAMREARDSTGDEATLYMWVDSLCIIQDDAEDWARESLKMKDVYANAYLTISASALGRNGCYPHKLTESRHARILHGEDEMKLIPQPFPAVSWNLPDEPLQKRGETEECAAHRFATTFFYREWIDFAKGTPTNSLFYLPLLLPTSTQPTQALVLWYKMLVDYSARVITEPSDKFPAIEGITQRFKMWIKSDCLHGLWKSDLAYGLMWRRVEDTYDSDYCHRLVRGRGPSWSWVSMDGLLDQLGIYLKLSMWKISQDDHQALEASVTVADEDEHSIYADPTSITNPCLLRIRGQLLALKYDYGSDIWGGSIQCWRLQDPQPGDKDEVDFTPDDPSFDQSEYTSILERKIYLVPLIGLVALVVTRTDRHNVYRRVGLSKDMILADINYGHLSARDLPESTGTSDFTQESCFGGDGAEDEDVAALEDSGEGLGGGRRKKFSANSASSSSSVSQDESSQGESESGSGSKTPLPWERQYSPSATFCTIFLC